MEMKTGEKYLITTNDWFASPDGQLKKAVYGTVHSISSDEETLNIKTNRHSANWYVQIGGMIVAGCQIHYVIRTDKCSDTPPTHTELGGGKPVVWAEECSRIYFAD